LSLIQRGLKVGAHASSFDETVNPESKYSDCRTKAKIPGAKNILTKTVYLVFSV
jgi:hypothetical protein